MGVTPFPAPSRGRRLRLTRRGRAVVTGFCLAVISAADPSRMVVARMGAPLALGLGEDQKTVLRGGAGIFYNQTGSSAIADLLQAGHVRWDSTRARLELTGSSAPTEYAAVTAAIFSRVSR